MGKPIFSSLSFVVYIYICSSSQKSEKSDSWRILRRQRCVPWLPYLVALLNPIVALGSWADEVDALPNARMCDRFNGSQFLKYTAAASRIDEESTGDRFSRRDDFSSSRCTWTWNLHRLKLRSILFEAERRPSTFREDVPLPTQQPFTAFIGNLAFDLTESELEEFFSHAKVSDRCF